MMEFIRVGHAGEHKIMLDVMGPICISAVSVQFSKPATMIKTLLGEFYVRGTYEEVCKAVARRRQQVA